MWFVDDFRTLSLYINCSWRLNLLQSFLPFQINIAWVSYINVEYITGDRFSIEFLEKRRSSLQLFLDRISRHPILQMTPCFLEFLKTEQMASIPSLVKREANVFENISEAFINACSKVRRPEERFIEIKDTVGKLEQNLTNIEKQHSKLLKCYMGNLDSCRFVGRYQ